MVSRFWVETLGCPKNQVDSDKLIGTLVADGMAPAGAPEDADLVLVNTCAFIEAARQESVDTVLALADARRPGARLVVTGCMAERYGAELAEALPEVDAVAGFGVPVTLRSRSEVPAMDLLNLPRPRAASAWAYVKVAEGCDRTCGFCAIPSFRGRQRSRSMGSILAEVDALAAQEVVLVAQDLASYGRDEGRKGDLVPLVEAVGRRVPRVRLLYLYPSELGDGLIDAICATGVPYFDLSLQHVSKPLLRRMRR
jgi:ribosomal protein S12 methylthiotransferase